MWKRWKWRNRLTRSSQIYFDTEHPQELDAHFLEIIMNNIYLSERFSRNFAKNLQEITESSLEKADEFLHLNHQNFDIYIAPDDVEDGGEITVFPETYASGLVNIRVIKNYNPDELTGELFHELSHVKWAETHDEDDGYELFNFAINEGVAELIKFEIAKKTCVNLPKYVGIHQLLSRREILNGLREIITITEKNLPWNKNDWFWNFAKNARYPPNFGYHIGMFIVREFSRKYDLEPTKLTNISYEKFYIFAKNLVKNSLKSEKK